jgi:hypothetical protein
MGLDPPNATRLERRRVLRWRAGSAAGEAANLMAECADFMAPKTIFRERDSPDLDCGRPPAFP